MFQKVFKALLAIPVIAFVKPRLVSQPAVWNHFDHNGKFVHSNIYDPRKARELLEMIQQVVEASKGENFKIPDHYP